MDAELSTFRRRGVLDGVMGPYDRAAIAVSLLETAVRCGDLEAAREMADAVLAGRHGNPQAVLDAELGLAVVDLLSGRLGPAEAAATRLVDQAAAMGDPHAREVAESLVDHCRSASGRTDERPGPRRAVGRPGGRGTGARLWGRFGWCAEVLDSMTADPDRADEGAPARLDVLADRAGGAGLRLVELHALLASALLGDAAMAGRLRASAVRTQSTVSGPGADLATAILGDDPARTFAALTSLAATGHLAWSNGPPSAVVSSLAPADARRLAELVARHQRTPAARSLDAPGWLQPLTPREREIAGMVVDGLSNASIARHHCISVRTVEGHLNQVYAKLHVRGRWELSRLAADAPTLEIAGNRQS